MAADSFAHLRVNSALSLAAGARTFKTYTARTFKTYTDRRAEFRFYNTPEGQGELAALGERFPLKVGHASGKQTLKLTQH
jgi:hypothetical protein